MSSTYRELRSLTDDQLIDAHDGAAKNTVVGVSYFLDELRRREQARTNRNLGVLVPQVGVGDELRK
jgi:hypothetical protein